MLEFILIRNEYKTKNDIISIDGNITAKKLLRLKNFISYRFVRIKKR